MEITAIDSDNLEDLETFSPNELNIWAARRWSTEAATVAGEVAISQYLASEVTEDRLEYLRSADDSANTASLIRSLGR